MGRREIGGAIQTRISSFRCPIPVTRSAITFSRCRERVREMAHVACSRKTNAQDTLNVLDGSILSGQASPECTARSTRGMGFKLCCRSRGTHARTPLLDTG